LLSAIVAVCTVIALASRHLWVPRPTEVVAVASIVPTDTNEPIQPIVMPANLDARKIELGRKFFHDPILSEDNHVSCASCHDLAAGGTDRRVHSIGIHGSVGVINAPSVLNSGTNFTQFWDGRAPTLEKQIDDPLQSKIEMGSTWPEVISKLKTLRMTSGPLI
jgi:cytochrome c peroxidase